MSYYVRYICTDPRPVSLDDLRLGLATVDPQYSIVDDELHFDGELYGQLDVNARGTELCDEELDELQEFLEDAESGDTQRVVDCLTNATSIIAIQVLWQGREPEPTLERVYAVLEWLLANRSGIAQVDDNGYYDSNGQVVAVS
ncbi:hypothetical protein LF1_56670 [Rubripirellula obstinata]|uniref:Uncharacterized protein n=1 Tax=Rubripirellula obstinata TaxID=406547 RepID=A0A5B1CBK2_9BACT|nr:hypothetical protein [Rubripirellula obstinata]KAA1257029.1 hypothetical protein LF1_56670 [Rubripirellula obstinata]